MITLTVQGENLDAVVTEMEVIIQHYHLGKSKSVSDATLAVCPRHKLTLVRVRSDHTPQYLYCPSTHEDCNYTQPLPASRP